MKWKHAGKSSTSVPPVSQLSPEVERRRRLVTRTLPLALVAVVAFVIGAALGQPGSPERDAANRFAEAWAAEDYGAMYRELNDASRARVKRADFVAAYRDAEQTATLRSLEAGAAHEPITDGETAVAVPLTLATRAFGRFENEILLPFEDGGIAWAASLV